MNLLLQLALPLLSGLGLSYLLEQTLTPKPIFPWQRGFANHLLHIGIWLLLCTILLLSIQRPWFVVMIVLAYQFLLVMVNYAKYSTLKEAFICQDFEYFTDAIKHPRLYLPFLGVARTLAALFAFIAVVYLGFSLEPALTNTYSLTTFLSDWLALLLASLGMIAIGNQFCQPASHKPNQDLMKMGQAAFYWRYWRDEKQNITDIKQTVFADLPNPADQQLGDVIVVQSESFFDPRPFYQHIKTEVLQHFDQLKAEAVQYGRLHVPAWGANTVRTECGFLTGLKPAQMGIHQFNPYHYLAKEGVANIASYLKKSGYKTICIHPYPASFYQRHQVYPRMGFDEFIDIKAFSEEQKHGQYTSDLAVAEKISELLASNPTQPMFIFVITMENHGPLHLEKPEKGDAEKFYHTAPSTKAQDLTVYLRHLHNADKMAKKIRDELQERYETLKKNATFCWYGDHVPIMAAVYQELGEPDGLTDYFIWRTAEYDRKTSSPQTGHIDELAIQIMQLPQRAV
ncbi:LTA synthase family protein [Methylosoma difficile]